MILSLLLTLSGCASISPSITFTKGNHIIEYGKTIKEEDLEKYIKSSNGDITIDYSSLDTNKEGTYTIKYTATKWSQEETKKLKVKVEDTQKPVIQFKKESISATIGNTIDFTTNIEKVKDPVDGDLTQSDTLENGTYVIDSSDVDTKNTGTYKVVVTAKDQNGNLNEDSYAVTIKDDASKRPAIQINQDTVTITEGDSYDLNSNVTSVIDPIDGALSYQSISADYDSTRKITENKDLVNSAGGYGFYTVLNKNFSADKAGTYQAMVVAVNKRGHQTTKEFKVIVEEKEITFNDILNDKSKYENKEVEFEAYVKDDDKLYTTDQSQSVSYTGMEITETNKKVKVKGMLKKQNDDYVFVIMNYSTE